MSKKNALSRHEEVEDLLGTPPSWLIRWGITVIVIIVITIFIGAYFFRYPEVVTNPVVITTEHPAIWLVSKINGRIDSIYIKDHSRVHKDQIIATIENTATIEDVFILKKELELISHSIKKGEMYASDLLSKNLNVGELNDCYSQLIRSIDNYILFKKEKYHDLKIKSLTIEKNRKIQHFENLEQQKESYNRYYNILQKQYIRDSTLFLRKIITVTDFESIQKEKISSEIQLYQSLSNLSSVQLEIHNTEQSIAELNIDQREKEKDYYNSLIASYELLYNRVKEWEKKYIMRAPSDGKISFIKYWSKNQYINAEEKIFTIIPNDYGAILGRCYIKTSGIGKIKKGQPVIIKLDEYPYMEFGMLKGFVSNLSLIGMEANQITDQSRYAVVEIELNKNDLKTTYNKSIDFKGELTGTAEIATKQMSLLEHLINPLKYLWSNIE